MQKNRYIFFNISTVLTSKFLQIFIIILLLIIGYFTSTLERQTNYFEGLVNIFTYEQFLTLCYLPMVILGNLFIINLFDKNLFYIIRFKNKKNYIKELLKNIIVLNTIIFIIVVIIIITFFNFFSNGDFIIEYINFYKTNSLIYFVYVLIKMYFLTILFSIITTLFFKLFNKNLSLFFSIIITISLFLCQFISVFEVNNLLDIPLYFGIYFLNIIVYRSFAINIISFVIICLILIIVIGILYKKYINSKKGIL